jgi:23S rRNA pseudouridine1911/1915/1917 synthase
MNARSFVVSDEEVGTRIDRFLTKHHPNESRSAIQKWLERKLVCINQQPAKASYRLRNGDLVEVLMPEMEEPSSELASWNFPLEILYEDDALLAINKPPHTVVHPGAGSHERTIVQAALHHFPEIRNVGHSLRPGVVHRLDKETSGLLLLVKTQEAYLKLTRMFKERSIKKHYRAAVFGKLEKPSARIEKPLGRDPVNRKKISVRARKARAAITIYKLLQPLDFGGILDVEILTGRTHQIRVHLSSEKLPIVGDTKYGGANWNRIPDMELRNRLKQSGFFGLHAYTLEFLHPVTGKRMQLQAPLPPIWNFLTTA